MTNKEAQEALRAFHKIIENLNFYLRDDESLAAIEIIERALTEASKVDVVKDLDFIKERVQDARDKLNKTIEEIIKLETTIHYNLVKKGGEHEN